MLHVLDESIVFASSGNLKSFTYLKYKGAFLKLQTFVCIAFLRSSPTLHLHACTHVPHAHTIR